MKLKLNIIIAAMALVFLACNNDDDTPVDNFDAVAQALIDDEILVEFLSTHYYIPATGNEVFGKIDTILNNESSLMSQVDIENITHDDINYKLYYYIHEQGINENPTRFDSIFVRYRGYVVDSTDYFEEINNFNGANSWFNLAGSNQGTDLIQGWKYGFPHYKGGTNTSQQGQPISFEDTGKGVIFFPSGLGYANVERFAIPVNSPLMFHLELAQVVRADNDNDGLLNIFEDLDNDGNGFNDDTDGDTFPNFVDADDDNDGVPTRIEDLNEDGDARNDDTDGDTIPNYRDDDDDNDGILTVNEDRNGDGDRTNDDTDNDGIPDYLDPDN